MAAYPDVFKPWDFPNRRGLWKGQKGKELAAQATRWLVEDQLQLSPDEVPERIRTRDFRAAGLGSLLANCPAVYGSIFCACKLAYPKAGYQRATFKGLRIEIELGLALERITRSLYDLEGEATFRFNKTAANCTHKRRCKPDFMLCDNGEWDREWVDCKLHWYTFYNGEAKRYLDHCEKLTIIHLDQADDVFETDRVAFVPVRERFAHLRQRSGAADLFADLDKLSASVLPERFTDRAGGVMSEQLSWSPLDLDHLRKRASDYTAAELGRQHGKSRSAVYNQAKRMKLAVKPDGFWNAQRDAFVRDSYEGMDSPTIARELGEPCTHKMVTQRIIKLGLKRAKTWTAEKHQFLEDNFRTMTNVELATELKVTSRAISVRLSKCKLRR